MYTLSYEMNACLYATHSFVHLLIYKKGKKKRERTCEGIACWKFSPKKSCHPTTKNYN